MIDSSSRSNSISANPNKRKKRRRAKWFRVSGNSTSSLNNHIKAFHSDLVKIEDAATQQFQTMQQLLQISVSSSQQAQQSNVPRLDTSQSQQTPLQFQHPQQQTNQQQQQNRPSLLFQQPSLPLVMPSLSNNSLPSPQQANVMYAHPQHLQLNNQQQQHSQALQQVLQPQLQQQMLQQQQQQQHRSTIALNANPVLEEAAAIASQSAAAMASSAKNESDNQSINLSSQ
jgi:hypothetical protein